MPNITYIKFTRNFFNATNGQLPFSALAAAATTNTSKAYPDNVILLIEEHKTAGATDDGFHIRSTASVTFMVLAWALMLIGFTLCWCFQLFEKKKSQQEHGGAGDRSNNRANGSGTQACEQQNGRCFVLDGDSDTTTTTVELFQDNSIELQTLDSPQNYSILISKLERLALGLNSDLENLTNLGKKRLEIAFNENISGFSGEDIGAGGGGGVGVVSSTPAIIRIANGMTEAEYNRVVSDIWIGVILTLLIVTVIFFICSCFLYHKFQQWKNSYHANDALDPTDVIRRYDLDVESLPSYTIVSGLPTYDDALEEFRKAGLILKAPIPMVKIFDYDSKDSPPGDGLPEYVAPDSISISSTCACGNATAPMPQSQIIELNPEHLKILSQKRLSLQISFNALPTNIRRNSRPRVDLCQQVGRNNLLRARREASPEIHRSSSMTFDNERIVLEHRLRHLEQHRGSIS